MIEELDKNSKYLEILEKNFPDVFMKGSIDYDIQNNLFTHYLVYLMEDFPVAFINYYIMYERAEVINIHVLDSYQNQGIATRIMECMIEECNRSKVISITLEVKCTNQKAIHLYQKFGFREVGIRKGYYQGIDALLMEKELM